ncbi:PDZ domain-containing protein [Lacticaseibacillus nasuensis]|uniref:PDZ domain-containing protein n=1 Tax=Lacticaseibacillus nasuensis TaxID=944671 RepID=UPI002247A6C2|nr:PDZ domain-containing protein [Lacticaseibacillus nasuensis]MCX2454677.1 PDZ domain-containing protein [Lacticaseibacillus nasuensis]
MALAWLFIINTVAGTLSAYGWHRQRLTHERKLFGQAIDRQALNLWAYLIGGVLGGLAISVVAIGLGLRLPNGVLVWLSALTLLALALAGLGFSPWWLSFAGLFASGIGPLIPWAWAQAPAAAGWAWRYLALVALVWAVNGGLLRLIDPPSAVPTVVSGNRGADIAQYTHRQFYWLPLVLPLPGTWLAALPWWPALHVGGTSFALTLLPLIIGAGLKTRRTLPSHVVRRWAWQYWGAAGALVILAGLAWGWPALAIGWLAAAAGVGVVLGGVNAMSLYLGNNYVSRTDLGVRLIAVQPGTPAAKMHLQAGDIVLTCNGRAVRDAASLYAAIQTQPTYCRLKVQRFDGALELTETAIFQGAPHELGMITFTEEPQ